MEDNYFSKRQGVTVFKCLDSSSYLTYFLSNSKYLLSAYYMLDPTLLNFYLLVTVSASGWGRHSYFHFTSSESEALGAKGHTANKW